MANVTNWQSHVETVEEKSIYTAKKDLKVLLDLDASRKQSLESVEEDDSQDSSSQNSSERKGTVSSAENAS